MTSVLFLGLHTAKFDDMRRLYADAYRLPVLHEAPGVV
jgi:hypothetical protein